MVCLHISLTRLIIIIVALVLWDKCSLSQPMTGFKCVHVLHFQTLYSSCSKGDEVRWWWCRKFQESGGVLYGWVTLRAGVYISQLSTVLHTRILTNRQAALARPQRHLPPSHQLPFCVMIGALRAMLFSPHAMFALYEVHSQCREFMRDLTR